MASIPSPFWPDQTLTLLRKGNLFISHICDQLDTDVFETRLLFNKTICMRGQNAAKLFYDKDKFKRQDAAPQRLQRTLTGEGGVQSLDGELHRRRKAMFMALMRPENLQRLVILFEKYWERALDRRDPRKPISLYREANKICLQTACEWSGMSVENEDTDKLTHCMLAMIESPAAIGKVHQQGINARLQAEQWVTTKVRQIRQNPRYIESAQPSRCALDAFALTTDSQGKRLDEHSVAVDVLNVIRPIVAIGRYITFAALAMHRYPQACATLNVRNEQTYEHFAQEVRRFYPYFPFIAARVKKNFIWLGMPFRENTRVLLDLYGTNRDPSYWSAPNAFAPERFASGKPNAFGFIPQGGGSYDGHHRCAGELVTMAIMTSAIKMLHQHMQYTVMPQDLDLDFSKMPTLPKSGFTISNIKFIEPEVVSVCGEEDPGIALESVNS